ncbi:MAG: hypothetical protein O2955_13850 [Planctomycetota bacterium]|nr:hypothetical protein [Planctomycetota bacterium]MDA1213594.1 hypothetical protein [Planctomycetota bacterium]
MNGRSELVDGLDDLFAIVVEEEVVQFQLWVYVVPYIAGQKRGNGNRMEILIAPEELRDFESFAVAVCARKPNWKVDRPKLKTSWKKFRENRGQVKYDANNRALVLTNTATAKRLKVGYESIGVSVFLDDSISSLPNLTFSPGTIQEQIDRIANPCIAAFGQ